MGHELQLSAVRERGRVGVLTQVREVFAEAAAEGDCIDFANKMGQFDDKLLW